MTHALTQVLTTAVGLPVREHSEFTAVDGSSLTKADGGVGEWKAAVITDSPKRTFKEAANRHRGQTEVQRNKQY